MANETVLTLDEEIKQGAMGILNELNIDLSTAVNMFLVQVRLMEGIPFEISALPWRERLKRDNGEIPCNETTMPKEGIPEQKERKKANLVSNGMINVPNIAIPYRGYIIRPKLDMGSTPWRCNGNDIRSGYIVVTQANIQAMPCGAWFNSVIEAKCAVDILIDVGADGFHEAYNRLNGMDLYEEV